MNRGYKIKFFVNDFPFDKINKFPNYAILNLNNNLIVLYHLVDIIL